MELMKPVFTQLFLQTITIAAQMERKAEAISFWSVVNFC
jgi:hypothetical protein